jgi:hypothetical protein
MGLVVAVEGQAELPQVVSAAGSGGGRPDPLRCGECQTDEERHQGEDDEQFDEAQSPPGTRRAVWSAT